MKKNATLSVLMIALAFGVGSGSALETTRQIPAHALPVPETASPALQAMIAAPLDAAILYANGHDLKDPMLSPVYGDVKGFPPTILTTGTRDLFLSNTVRMHRKLREAGVVADLLVFEGLSHAQYLFDADAPESKEHFADGRVLRQVSGEITFIGETIASGEINWPVRCRRGLAFHG